MATGDIDVVVATIVIDVVASKKIIVDVLRLTAMSIDDEGRR